jgi:hypothetical protein
MTVSVQRRVARAAGTQEISALRGGVRGIKQGATLRAAPPTCGCSPSLRAKTGRWVDGHRWVREGKGGGVGARRECVCVRTMKQKEKRGKET